MATFKGRDAISHTSSTIADIFKENGYSTAIFGKWHLGDNYPVRPTDCGFDYAVHHSSVGVGELSDYWGNNYFDDIYPVNNEPKQFKGYCIDVWFDQAIKHIKKVRQDPFFIYLPTYAPHVPLIVADKYKIPYDQLEDSEIQSASYLGMIANIDVNFGKLDQFLKDSGLAENTLLIFLTDNGTQYGFSLDKKLGYNKGFRSNKSNKEEGGHRVPFIVRLPKAGVENRHEVDILTAHIDIIPTLAGLCNLELPQNTVFDGLDYSQAILGKPFEKPDRTVFIHHRQDWKAPLDVEDTCLMKNQWRLINGNDLYDIEKDPMQKTNIIQNHQALVYELLKENDKFLNFSKQLDEYKNLPVAIAGTPFQKEIKLTIQHAIGEGGGTWKSEHVAAGVKNPNNKYALEISKAGRYRISCRRWPKECPGAILGVPSSNPKNQFKYRTVSPEKVRLEIFDKVYKSDVSIDHRSMDFVLDLPAGKTMLQTDFVEGDKTYGVYYNYIEKVSDQ